MKITEFQTLLQQKYPQATIKLNENRPGLANVFLNGVEICPIPSGDIKEEPDPGYRFEFPNGMLGRHNSIADVYAKIEAELRFQETEEGQELSNEEA